MKGNKILSAVIACVLAGILTAGVCIVGFVSRSDNGNWFKNSNLKTWHWARASGDGEIDETGDNGISLLTEVIPFEEYGENGISEEATKAYKVTATVNEEAKDKRVVGELSWKNGSSDWATDKLITDYAVLSQTTEYGLEFNLEILQAFGEPITLKVASYKDSNINATAEVNYVKELISCGITINPELPETAVGRLYVGNKANTVSLTPVFGVGTVEGEVKLTRVGMHITTEWVESLTSELAAGNNTGSCHSWPQLNFNSVIDGSFTIPLTSLFWVENDKECDMDEAENIVNDFMIKYGCGVNATEDTIIAIDIVRATVSYSYGEEYKKSVNLSGTNALWAFNNEDLIKSTITDIVLDKDEIVVYPG